MKSITVNSPTQLTFKLTASYNPTWFTYNQLVADHAAAGGLGRHHPPAARPGRADARAAAYGTADAACAAVYTFLSKQAGYDPANPKAANNVAGDLRHQPALAGRRRAVAPDVLRRLGAT